MHRIRAKAPPAGVKGDECAAWCARNGVSVLPAGIGEVWLAGHALKVTEAVRKFWPRAEVAATVDRIEPVPTAVAAPPAPPEERLPMLWAAVRLVEMATSADLVDRVHGLVEGSGHDLTYLQLQCLGRDGPWAASFSTSTVGCDDPWFEDEFVGDHRFAARGDTREQAVAAAAALVLTWHESARGKAGKAT